ncbi:glycoside hydrolase family 9 protein [Streptomyces sp. TRM 70351]|uniref:glycoside hydrolase family 9 protein n=1 Tax=Streptomyces sp. TRM 70351 TaxID=3116552 RepID=UPI002E7C2A3B|nr:glycoside hydrolase family 9 protein [Streptomyces sp. TRM 70351]MEE1927441.1 glycoside hydrolase family 9 protein [Streptomyces sp. TRM 70351]
MAASVTAPAVAQPAAPAAEGPELISNGSFDSGTAPWWWTENTEGAVVDGRLCADIPGDLTNPWDAIVGHDDLPLTAGESYTLSYSASSTAPITVRTLAQMAADPWTAELSANDRLGAEPTTFEHVFTAGADHEAAQLVFQVGGSAEPTTFCLDDVSLRGGAEPPVYEPDTGSPVRVNQVGYLTHGPKSGTVVTDATTPLTWTVNAADGSEAASGTTTPEGVDPTSRQNVHTFDFSNVTEAGDGYTVTVDGQTSEPFSLGSDLYEPLRTDALAYFYHNRSGIEIDGDLVGEEYARPAGHVGVAPNQGDLSVPCQPGVCDYRLDVSGGWYDAGDHGKYVVNGGISVAQLMSSYERTLTVDGADGEPLGDGRLRVPEHGNGTPDILDEVRWQMDFLMRMQVPEGEPLAGMVHHKIHDRAWTGLPLLPHEDPQPRELHPASTAATLNVAATGAQCARLFEPYDADFAATCLDTARTAWAAAQANPEVYADPNDGVGGGAYSDGDVRDEFYWAAAELFTTTGDETFRQAILDSELHGDTDAVFPRGGISWGATSGLGALTLATVPNEMTDAQLDGVRDMVTEAADGFAADSDAMAYGLPYAPSGMNYVWGSNSQVLNNMVVLATAHDLTGESDYRDAVLRGMDYLLGRNPLNQSYVTGYGERDSKNQHHRFWANQLDASLPNPAPGSVAGGPNVSIDDPIAQDMLQGCAPAMCYVDHIESWATNEITINWNAPLAWIASYLDDLGTGDPSDPGDPGDPGDPEPAACEVTFSSNRWNGGFTSNVTVKNTGTSAVDGWELTWSYADGQRVTHHWNAQITQSGRDVTAKPVSWNRTLAPGASASFGFNGTVSGAAADPTEFSLNGGDCDTP